MFLDDFLSSRQQHWQFLPSHIHFASAWIVCWRFGHSVCLRACVCSRVRTRMGERGVPWKPRTTTLEPLTFINPGNEFVPANFSCHVPHQHGLHSCLWLRLINPSQRIASISSHCRVNISVRVFLSSMIDTPYSEKTTSGSFFLTGKQHLNCRKR